MFETKGSRSLPDACREVLSGLAEGDGVEYGALIGACATLTGRDDLDRRKIIYAAGIAIKRMIRDGERAVRNVPLFGYVRASDTASYELAQHRMGKTRRQIRWAGQAALATRREGLSWPERQRLDVLINVTARLSAVDGRKRLRPLPAGPEAPPDA